MLETNTNPCGYVFCVYVHVNAHNAFEISNHNYWVINGTHFDISKRAFTIKSRPETCIFYTFSGVYFKALNLKLYILKEAKNMFREVHWINFQGLYTDNVLSTVTPWVPVITPPHNERWVNLTHEYSHRRKAYVIYDIMTNAYVNKRANQIKYTAPVYSNNI